MKLSLLLIHDFYDDADRSRTELYWESIRQGQLAEKLGYDAVWIAEHHFSNYGVVPNPAVLLSYLAATTKRIKLGPAIVILPYHDPRTVAETYLMLDQISGGRVQLGVGPGFQPVEYAAYDIDINQRKERFSESLEAIQQLISGKPATFQGKHYRLKDVTLNVRSVQPKVPIFIATNRVEGAAEAGALGLNVFCVPYAGFQKVGEISGYMESFKAARAAAGCPATPGSVQFAFQTYVGESESEARETAQAAYDRYIAVRTAAAHRTYDEILTSGLVLYGSPNTVRDQLIHLLELGATHILTVQSFGLIPAAKVEASMTRLAETVLPSVLQHARTLPVERELIRA